MKDVADTLSLFDLHCDTAYEMHRQNQSLETNNLAISLESARKFKRYVQVMAIWTDSKLSDEEGWIAAHQILSHLTCDDAIKKKRALLCESSETLDPALPSLLLGLEDARILANRAERVDALWEMGVRILTPLWKGETCIGGSHNTEIGLTDFGHLAMRRAAERGMILDISHASEQSAQDIFAIAEEMNRPVVATHSNAYEVCPVSRNLRRWQVDTILKRDGVIGLNLYTDFLCIGRKAHVADILPHIEFFLEQGAEDHLCLGCDMDGATMPPEIQGLSQLDRLAELLLQRNYSEDFVHKLFFANAYRFATQFLK